MEDNVYPDKVHQIGYYIIGPTTNKRQCYNCLKDLLDNGTSYL